MEYFSKLLQELDKLEFVLEILNVNYVVYAVEDNSNFGSEILSMLGDNSKVVMPKILICFNTTEKTLKNSSILDKIEGKITTEELRDVVLRNLESKEDKIEKQINQNTTRPSDTSSSNTSNNTKNMGNMNNNLGGLLGNDGDTPNLTNAEMIQIQKEELEQLEWEEEEKKLRQLQDEEKIKEEEIKLKVRENKRNEEIEDMKKKIPSEPEFNDPNSTNIILRYPDGNKRIERRFNKSDTVKNIYDFVFTLGDDVLTESEEFDLITPFPFKAYTNMELTLEDEKLFPNAVLQIREI